MNSSGLIFVDALFMGKCLARFPDPANLFWVRLQAQYDLDVAERTLRSGIDKEVAPRAAA